MTSQNLRTQHTNRTELVSLFQQQQQPKRPLIAMCEKHTEFSFKYDLQIKQNCCANIESNAWFNWRSRNNKSVINSASKQHSSVNVLFAIALWLAFKHFRMYRIYRINTHHIYKTYIVWACTICFSAIWLSINSFYLNEIHRNSGWWQPTKRKKNEILWFSTYFEVLNWNTL